MPHDDIDVLDALEHVPALADAQIWLLRHRCRVYRGHPDGGDQVVDLEMSHDSAGRWRVVATDAARGLTAEGVPMPGLNSAVHMVPWYMLDDPAEEKTSGA